MKKQCLQGGGAQGSGKFNWSSNKLKRLAQQIYFFEQISGNEANFVTAVLCFVNQDTMDLRVFDLNSQITGPFTRDLRIVIEDAINKIEDISDNHSEGNVVSEIDVFISHSGRDKEIADHLVALIRSSLNYESIKILCTSVGGHGLAGGVNIHEELRQKIMKSKTFVAIITPASIESAYVLFELGARWGLDKPLIPLLAHGADSSYLLGPLEPIYALCCDKHEDILKFIEDLAESLNVSTKKPTLYHKYVDNVIKESKKKPK